MKKIILTLAIGMIFLLTILPNFVTAEMNYWTDVNIDYSDQTATQHGYYQFDDTSETGVGRNKPIDVILYYDVEGLPYDLTASNYSGYVDWCNLSIIHYQNEYGTEFIAWQGFVGGEYINTTTETDNVYFVNTTNHTSGQFEYELKDKDSLIYDMTCHYTELDDVFVESILFGRVTTYFSAYECDNCEEFSLEELSDAVERNEGLIASQNEVYVKVQRIVGYNFQFWLIISWLIKIGMILTGVYLLFSGVFMLYQFLKDIERQI